MCLPSEGCPYLLWFAGVKFSRVAKVPPSPLPPLTTSMVLSAWFLPPINHWFGAHTKLRTSWSWAVPSSVEVEVRGLVKALSLIFENGNVEEVWSQRSFKIKKLLDEKVWSWGSFRWWNLKLKKFQVNEVWNWRTLKLKKTEVEEDWS